MTQVLDGNTGIVARVAPTVGAELKVGAFSAQALVTGAMSTAPAVESVRTHIHCCPRSEIGIGDELLTYVSAEMGANAVPTAGVTVKVLEDDCTIGETRLTSNRVNS